MQVDVAVEREHERRLARRSRRRAAARCASRRCRPTRGGHRRVRSGSTSHENRTPQRSGIHQRRLRTRSARVATALLAAPGASSGRAPARGAGYIRPLRVRPARAAASRRRRAAVAVVDDVDRVVLLVRAGDAEQHRRPPRRAELALAAQLAARRRARRRARRSRAPSTCGTPLTNTSNGRVTSAGSGARVRRRASLGHLHRMTRPCAGSSSSPSRSTALALAVAAPALAGNGGFAPVPPESPNAEGITQSYWFVTAFVLAIFVLVEGLLVAFVSATAGADAPARRRRRADPRLQPARALVDGRPGRDPRS